MRRAVVTVRRYGSLLDARLAQAKLEAHGIPSFLPDEQFASIDPLLIGAIGHVRLQVPHDHLAVAIDVLDAPEPENADADELDDGPRCPKCESAYCRTAWSPAQLVIGAIGLGLPLAHMAKRMLCDRCEHVWPASTGGDQPAKPNVPYRTPASPRQRDGRPVFRLRRSGAGAGLLLGLSAGMLFAVALGATEAVPVVLALSPVAGMVLGHRMKRDVCSDPKCRAPLPRDVGRCEACSGSVQGVIVRAADHWSAKAAWHRGDCV